MKTPERLRPGPDLPPRASPHASLPLKLTKASFLIAEATSCSESHMKGQMTPSSPVVAPSPATRVSALVHRLARGKRCSDHESRHGERCVRCVNTWQMEVVCSVFEITNMKIQSRISFHLGLIVHYSTIHYRVHFLRNLQSRTKESGIDRHQL